MYENDPIINNLLEKLPAISLRPEAKARMRADLSAFADFHAIADEVRETHLVAVHAPARTRLFSTRGWFAPFAGALTIVLMTGTTYAAEKTIPGDTLYPIKVRVTEPVQLALSATPESKAKTHTALADRRLKEAEVLAVNRKLDDGTQAYLQQEFSKHVDRSLAAAETLSVSGKKDVSLEVRSSLEAQLIAHEDILDEVEDHLEETGDEGDGMHESTRDLREAVEVRQEVVRETRLALERDLDPDTTPVEALAVVTKADAALPKTVVIEASMPAPVARRVEDAEKALEEAKETLEREPEDAGRAVRKARESERASEIVTTLVKHRDLLTAIAKPAEATTTNATTTEATSATTTIEATSTPEASPKARIIPPVSLPSFKR